ncbi:putative short-chain dehydrogenase/reductase SDR, NAD(P)-binding domain superfamily [Septoria linicola]|nr:putative short-chain dehydrogenase/reductase SDR, NAD(P)-binding domain superfamily [Septoria linicola]
MMTKTAYVTGGASGIGKAVAHMLSDRGIRVAIADINVEQAQAVASTLAGNAMALSVNTADWESQVTAFKTVLQSYQRIDYVYAIAGIGEKSWIPNDPARTDFVKPNLSALDVDLNGVLYTAALAIQQMRRQEPDEGGFRGKIAVAASVCGFYCVPTLPIYTAAKHGVVGFVRSYGKHLPAEQITLNAICPDVLRTGISKEEFYSVMEAKGF